MATILWPAFSDAVSDFLHRGKMLQSCCTEAAEGGNVDNVFTSCLLFLSLLFPPDFCGCSMDKPLSAFPQLLACFWDLLGETFAQQKRPRVRPLRCFHEMCGLIPVSIFPLFILKRVVERWPLREAVA
jgi:hypothetical protein